MVCFKEYNKKYSVIMLLLCTDGMVITPIQDMPFQLIIN